MVERRYAHTASWVVVTLACAASFALGGCAGSEGSDAAADVAGASDAVDAAEQGDSAGGAHATDATVAADAADVAAGHPSLAWPLGAPGPHRVGYRATTITYEGAGGIGSRTIPVHLWYPTAATSGEHPPPYGNLVVDKISLVDAEVAAPDDGAAWPVMVYSHGHQGFAGSSAFVAWHFASHGWIVAAPDHVGNLLSDAILPRPTWVYYARAFDISQTLDYVASLDAAAGFGYAKDTDHALLVGHSFGAHNCWAAAGATFDTELIAADCKEEGGAIVKDDCSAEAMAVFSKGLREPRIVAAVPLAGTIHRSLMGDKGHEGAEIPILSVSGTKDKVGAEAQFDSCEGCDLTWIELEGGTHQSFAVACSSATTKDKTCGVTLSWTLAFGRRHVLGDSGVVDLLEGKVAPDPLVKVYKRRKP